MKFWQNVGSDRLNTANFDTLSMTQCQEAMNGIDEKIKIDQYKICTHTEEDTGAGYGESGNNKKIHQEYWVVWTLN